MARANYRAAITWLAENDDNEWLDRVDDDECAISATGVLVADLFSKSDAEVIADLRRALKRLGQ